MEEKKLLTHKNVNIPDKDDEPVFVPQVDIIDRPDAVVLVADVPGAKVDDVDIKLENGILELRARVQPEEPEGCTLHYQEYSVGDFVRSFTVSNEIEQSKIEAEMKNGVLRVTFPKAENQKARKIEVKEA